MASTVTVNSNCHLPEDTPMFPMLAQPVMIDATMFASENVGTVPPNAGRSTSWVQKFPISKSASSVGVSASWSVVAKPIVPKLPDIQVNLNNVVENFGSRIPALNVEFSNLVASYRQKLVEIEL